MLISELKTEIALHIQDPSLAQFTTAQLLIFINSAARDLRDNGWLLRMEDDESLAISPNTPEYNVPASFVYIQDIWQSRQIGGVTHYDIMVPRGHWTLRINGGVPVIHFLTQTYLDTESTMKLVGQKRPTIYTLDADTVDPGLESVLRKLAVTYANLSAGLGGSELATTRRGHAQLNLAITRQFPPKEYRQLPSAKLVPGRG